MNNWNKIDKHEDSESNVIKFVYTNDSAVAESVLYKYPDYETRTVICCSTQSGCPVGCRFCGAGDYFVRNLTSDEIVEQVKYSVDHTGVDPLNMKRLQIMFMSMGEPLLNLKNLIPALRQLYQMYPNAALLISTSGPKVDMTQVIEISKEIPTIGLQFSIHETTDEERNALIPFKNKYTLNDIAFWGCLWEESVGRKPFFNYCAHDGNSSEENANKLFNLFNPKYWNATVSVVCERDEGMPKTNDHQRNLAVNFGEKLLERGFDVRVFDPAGQDTIGGGCGQLWFVQNWMKNNQNAKPSIGNGKEIVHVPM